MNIQSITKHRFYRPALGAMLTVFVGLSLRFLLLDDLLANASYDNLLRFGSRLVTNQVALVLMDNEAHERLGQSRGQWSRSLHTRLLNKLADDGCPLVVMDVFFKSLRDTHGDAELAVAMARLTNLVLTARIHEPEHPGIDAVTADLPAGIFTNAAKGRWGVAWFDEDADKTVRRHWPFPSPGPFPSLPWTAARLAGAHPGDQPVERWLRYYDEKTAWTCVSYNFALQKQSGYFRDRIVFIGEAPETKQPDRQNSKDDKFQTPHFNWTREISGGVILNATEFLNLVNGDALLRWSWPVEVLVLILSGAILGAGLARFRLILAMAIGLVAALGAMIGAVLLSYYSNHWFPWLIIVVGQVPCAMLFAVIDRQTVPNAASMPRPPQRTTSPAVPAAEQTQALHEVFISYATQDQAVAQTVRAGLEEHGLHCWIAPRDVLPGMEFREAIVAAIEGSRVMVLIFSKQVNESHFIRSEVDCAMDHGITVIPLLIEDVEPVKSLKFSLGNKHWMKAFPPPVKQYIAALACAVKQQLKTAAAVAATKPVAAKRLDQPATPKGTIILKFPEDPLPDAPEYEIITPEIGRGGFGKVWIVRNAIGQWQALKAVYASNFGGNRGPYEAEFKGLQRYKPVSEKHPGLLRIDLVSKMKPEGYFYYVMELGDALTPGWEKQPKLYKPRDLETLRKQACERRLPLTECLSIVTVLAEALNFLHEQGLTHRDVKPSNVIFVRGRPKLADVGLVAEIRPLDQMHTLVGTPGYMPPPPERPGTMQSDIYALGMVLYVISTGYDPGFFPDIATKLIHQSGHENFTEVNAIVLKACQPDLAKRYRTTAEMLYDLRTTLEQVQAKAI